MIPLMQVYKVLFPYSPQKDDELELLDGDYVYVSTADQGQTGMYCEVATVQRRDHGARAYDCL